MIKKDNNGNLILEFSSNDLFAIEGIRNALHEMIGLCSEQVGDILSSCAEESMPWRVRKINDQIYYLNLLLHDFTVSGPEIEKRFEESEANNQVAEVLEKMSEREEIIDFELKLWLLEVLMGKISLN